MIWWLSFPMSNQVDGEMVCFTGHGRSMSQSETFVIISTHFITTRVGGREREEWICNTPLPNVWVHGLVVALYRSTAPTTTKLPQANRPVLLQRYQINGGLAASTNRSADDRHAIPMLWCPKRLARPSELLTANSSDHFFCGRKQERFHAKNVCLESMQ